MSESDFRDDAARDEAELASKADEDVEVRDPGRIDEDDMAAAEGLETKPEVRESYEDALETGANVRGEGRPGA